MAEDAQKAQFTRVVILSAIALVGVGVIYFGIARPIMCKLRIISCKKQEENDQQILENFDNKGFDPEYFRTHTPSMSWDRAKSLAEIAYKAGGVFNDDESKLYSVLQEAKTYANLSLIASVFKNKYNESLAEWYAYYLDAPEEQQKIKTIIEEYR